MRGGPTRSQAAAGRGITLCRPREQSTGRVQSVDGARHTAATALEHVRVDHGRADVAMTEQLLDRPDVVTVLEQVGRERVSEKCGTRHASGFWHGARPP